MTKPLTDEQIDDFINKIAEEVDKKQERLTSYGLPEGWIDAAK
jgi:hypothetical protein